MNSMGKSISWALLVLFLLYPLPGAALDLSLGSRSYLLSREAGNTDHFLTFFEYLDSDLAQPGGLGFSVHAGGWGRVDFLDPSFEKHGNGELQYAYLSYAMDTSNAAASLGRLSINEGVAAAEQIDGLSLRSDLLWGFDVFLYGGVPVETNDDGRGSDTLYGGRISQGMSGLYRIGLSYLKEQNDGNDYREELGADLSFTPLAFLSLSGASSYNSMESTWMKHDYLLSLGIGGGLTLRGLLTWVDYDSYFADAENMVFRNPGFDPGETMLLAGGELAWEVVPGWTLTASFKDYAYHIAGNATAYGARLVWTGAGSAVGLSGELMRGEEDELRYGEYRAWGTTKVGLIDLTLDLLDTAYVQEVNGVKNAYCAAAGLGYDLGNATRLAVDVSYSHDAFYDRDVRGMLMFQYRFNYSTEGGRS